MLNFHLFHLKTTIFAVVLSIRLLMPSQIQNIFTFYKFIPIRIWAITLFLFCIQVVKSQDPIYSQYYNAHLQLNSALAGNTNGPLFQLNYRNQWPLLDKIYTTYSISYDQFVRRLNSGVGVQLVTDNAGDGTLRTTGLTGYYSYKLRVKKKSFIKGGMEIGYTNLGLDWNKLVFGDAIDPGSGHISPGGTPYPSKEQTPGITSKNLLNIGAGIVFFNPEYYVGVSLKNLNTPDISFLESGINSGASSQSLPVRFSLHGGKQIILRSGNKRIDPTFISPNIMYLRQGGFHQLNAGAYLSVNKIQGGLWYRHSLFNGDALITSFGVKKDFLKITYSFDLTLSQLNIRQGGAHELVVVVSFEHLYPKRQDYNDCFAIFR